MNAKKNAASTLLSAKPDLRLVPVVKSQPPSVWLIRRIMTWLVPTPDLDYSAFQNLEYKRSPQEMRRNGLY